MWNDQNGLLSCLCTSKDTIDPGNRLENQIAIQCILSADGWIVGPRQLC